MFAKGNRFPPAKPSEVPGPNAYNVEDPEFDAYKKGAILEKQERFGKEKESDVPGPVAYTTDTKPKVLKTAGGAKPTSGDRYAALQRKLEELERVHAESKKTHQADLERVKFDLSRAQKANAEHVERIDRLKKQNDLLEARTQELRKANLSDQSEIRDLRVKLRAVEHERAQLAGKQGEAGEAKKALQTLDAKRREELKEKDRKITDLEKTLAAEKKQRDILESRLAETKGKLDEEVRVQRGALEADLCQAKVMKERAVAELEELREHAQEMEEDLLEQLEQHKLLLCRVAAEYGRLAVSAVSKTAHERVQREARSLKCRVYRLERKYANAEGQVVELAQLIRQTSDQNSILQDRLREAEEDLIAYSAASSHTYKEALLGEQTDDLYTLMRDVFADIIRSDEETREFLRADWAMWSELDSLRSEQLLFHSTNLVKHALDARRQVEAQAEQLLAAEGHQSELSIKLSVAAAERDTTRAQLVEASTSLSIAQTRVKELEKELDAEKKRTMSEVARLEQAVRREKEAYEKTSGMLQQSRAAEKALTAEIDQLTADLADAERYQDAYASLVDQVDALVRKNALAEDEAQRISKFNAEILGHHNPAQRIMYVDRIRKELHETKHNFVMLTKERDALADENDGMQRELQMYKSVAVPADYKPRTTVTRVSRTPLANQSLNARSTVASKASSTLFAKRLESTPEDEYKEGDMTIDELL